MEMKRKKYIIYGLIDPETLELRYVGRSSSGLRRARSHFQPIWLNNQNYHISRWIKKSLLEGKKPEIVILEDYDNFDIDVNDWLNQREVAWIVTAKELGCRLTNATEGGGGTLGFKQSPETIERRASKLRGKKRTPEQLITIRKAALCRDKSTFVSGYKKGHVSWHKGKTGMYSAEAIEKMRKAKLGKPGRKHSEEEIKNGIERRQKIVICLNDGEMYDSTIDAAINYSMRPQSIARVARGEKKTNYGYKFRYLTEEEQKAQGNQ